jgi:uncharacterized membrane protein
MKWVSFLVLAAAAALLGLLWNDLPARWAIHWGLSGQPNGFATKTVVGVFAPLVLGAVIVASFEVMAQMMARRGPAGGRGPGVARAAVLPARIVALAVAIVFAGVALWLPLLHPVSPFPFVVFATAVIAGGLALAMVANARGIRMQAIDRPPQEGWHGLYYSNPGDDRLWVPKRLGLGWTLNFAKPAAWPLLLLMLSPAIIGVVVALWTTAH